MRAALLVALLLLPVLGAGCLGNRGGPEEPDAVPPWESAGAPLVAFHAQNLCGMCMGGAGFAHPEWTLVAVYENGRALRAHYNPAGNGEGLRLAPGLRHDRDELAAMLLPASARGFRVPQEEATAWVSDLERGAVDAGALARLREAVNGSWRPLSPERSLAGCIDCAGEGLWGRPLPNGTVELLHPNEPPPADAPPQQDFLRVMEAWRETEATFRASVRPPREGEARVVRISESITVAPSTPGDLLRGPGRCADVRWRDDGRDGGGLSVPLHPHAPLPTLVVARTLDPASLASAPVDAASVDPADHAAATADAPRVEVRSALDVGRVVLTVALREDGCLVVDGEPLDGPRTVRVEHEMVQERPDPNGGEGRGVMRFHVVETLVVTDAGTLPVAPYDPGVFCSG